jgi:transcriptional regulator with XRE-family HTH domain
MTVGERIVKYREKLRLTQSELAKRTKISQPLLSAIESGKRDGDRIALVTAKRLAKELHVSLDMLAGYKPREDTNGQTPHDSASTAPTSEAWIKTGHRSRGKN